MTTANTDANDLYSQAFGGLINEDVMQEIFDIAPTTLPLADRIGRVSMDNQYKSWTKEPLTALDYDNAVVDGSDATGNDTELGDRVGNHAQIMDKVIRTSSRARKVNTIGTADQHTRQIMKLQRKLLRERDGIMLTNQASVRDDGNTTAGRLGGLPAWIQTNANNDSARAGTWGFDSATGLVDIGTFGVRRALSEETLRDVAQAAWERGGDPTVLMSVADMIRQISGYMFTDGARIATLQRDTQGESSATALGAVTVLILDFDVVLELVASRWMQTYLDTDATPTAACDVLLLDPMYLAIAEMQAPIVEPIGKPGLSTVSQMHTDCTLVVETEEAHAIITEVDPSAAMVA